MQTTFSSTKRSSSISINFIVPQGWHELSDKQLRYVYQLIADGYSTDEVRRRVDLSFLIVDRIHSILQEKGLKQKDLANMLEKNYYCPLNFFGGI